MTKTRIVRISDPEAQKESLQEAGNVLSEGGLVIIPTETVYGIAANMLNKRAVARLSEIKGRPKDKPFSLHLEKKEKIEVFAKEISVAAYKLIYGFLPGPLTLVLKSRESARSVSVSRTMRSP
jgi:L-threonylcarbamoyladenylate synthase